MIDIICALCGKNQQLKALYPATFFKNYLSQNTYSARRIPDKIHYKINKCLKCGLVFSSPILPLKKQALFYKKSLCSYDDQIPYLIRTYFNIIEKIKDDLPKNPKVLEVGCGNGFFLKALKDRGFTKKVFGVEPSLKMVSSLDSDLRKQITIAIFTPSLFPKETFDLILCFHTLDHMIDPIEFVKGANSMLKKNGYIIAVVHDTEGLSVKMFGENSAIFDVEHIFLFNKKNLKEIFLRNKFKAVKVFNVVNKYPLNYWIIMSGFPLFIKKFVSVIVSWLRIGKISFSIPAGNIGIIARKKLN